MDDAQRLATGLVNANIALVTFNAPGGAEVKGVEVAGTLDLTSALRVGAAYTYTDAEYGSPRTATVLGAPFELVNYADVPGKSGATRQFARPLQGLAASVCICRFGSVF